MFLHFRINKHPIEHIDAFNLTIFALVIYEIIKTVIYNYVRR